jgi:hypothetical protein
MEKVRKTIPVMIAGLLVVGSDSQNIKAGIITKTVQGLVSKGKYFLEYKKKIYLHDD